MNKTQGWRGGLLFEAVRSLCLWAYARRGWTVEGAVPDTGRFVIIAAPHSSNWDFPLMLCVALHLRLKIHWIGKLSLFRWPMGGLMRALGGIPVDRSRSNNLVEQMAERFGREQEFALAVPPEGTRARVSQWKTGFLAIATAANVPIALGFLDYRRKVGGIAGTFMTTGDMDADMAAVRARYAGFTSLADLRNAQRR